MSSDSLIHAAAGAAGGCIAMAATYPLVVISTRAAVNTKKEKKTTYETITEVLRTEGIFSLYSGLSSSLAGIGVTNFVYYYFYERGRAAILASRPGSKGLTTVESLLNGMIAGSTTAILSNPIWVVQTQQAVQQRGSKSHSTVPTGSSNSTGAEVSPQEHVEGDHSIRPRKKSALETVQTIVHKGGVGALWAGIGPALVLVINPIIQYTAFEQLKNLIMTRRAARLRAAGSLKAASLSDLDYFLLGAISKLIATSITYPYIVVKSRLQAGSAKYSAVQGLREILKNEGLGGLYKGISSKVVQSVLTAAILFAGQKRVYEITKRTLLAANVVKA